MSKSGWAVVCAKDGQIRWVVDAETGSRRSRVLTLSVGKDGTVATAWDDIDRLDGFAVSTVPAGSDLEGHGVQVWGMHAAAGIATLLDSVREACHAKLFPAGVPTLSV